ncbi:MAG: glycosyltransferase family A protein [Bacteroidota bacterium]
MKDPKVSVVIPTYKRTAYLEKALISVVGQTFTDFEVLVVNDYPPFRDTVEEVVAKIGDSRIKLIHHEQNGGESQSRNTALAVAKGEIVALLDDDDVWKPKFLERSVEVHDANPRVGIVYTGLLQFWDDNILGQKEIAPPARPADTTAAMLAGKFVLASSSIVSLKKEVFDECGLFDTSLPSLADWDMWLRISFKYDIQPLDESLVYYRHHLGVRGSTDISKRLGGLAVVREKWGKQYPSFLKYYRRLRVTAYFNEIRNNVLSGNRSAGAKLLFKFIRDCGKDFFKFPNFFGFSVVLLVAGNWYKRQQLKKYPAKLELPV